MSMSVKFVLKEHIIVKKVQFYWKKDFGDKTINLTRFFIVNSVLNVASVLKMEIGNIAKLDILDQCADIAILNLLYGMIILLE